VLLVVVLAGAVVGALLAGVAVGAVLAGAVPVGAVLAAALGAVLVADVRLKDEAPAMPVDAAAAAGPGGAAGAAAPGRPAGAAGCDGPDGAADAAGVRAPGADGAAAEDGAAVDAGLCAVVIAVLGCAVEPGAEGSLRTARSRRRGAASSSSARRSDGSTAMRVAVSGIRSAGRSTRIPPMDRRNGPTAGRGVVADAPPCARPCGNAVSRPARSPIDRPRPVTGAGAAVSPCTAACTPPVSTDDSRRAMRWPGAAGAGGASVGGAAVAAAGVAGVDVAGVDVAGVAAAGVVGAGVGVAAERV
jgi:hypothetical protein